MNSINFQGICEQQDELLSLVGVGTWDLTLATGRVTYSASWGQMLGYSQKETKGTFEGWKSLTHPEDFPHSIQLLENYLEGKIHTYECEIRIKHRNGSYIWTRAVGKIVEWDAAGHPVRLVGVHLNINKLKCSEKHLSKALASLKYNHAFLENTVEKHTMEMVEQDKLLRTVNQISRKLLTVQTDGNFDNIVHDCLRLLGESIGKNRVYIWKNSTDEGGRLCCTQIYKWAGNVNFVHSDELLKKVPYNDLPTFQTILDSDRCLNCLLEDFSYNEKKFLILQNIKAVLIAPMTINGLRWGFIGVDNCENEQRFADAEENLIMMIGSMMASAIEKQETEAAMREMEERTQLMLNATPLCCNLWTPDFQNMSCNDEAVRLFELSSQNEYLERFYELSPERQPGGAYSSELSAQYISKAFKEGYCRFEWLHQKLDGTPVPAEITLVRIKYRDDFIVAGYTRDLREQKAMLAELRTKEALRRARDEALLNSKAKSNFLANMNHEIRTPLNAISGFTEIILRENANEKTTEYAKGIKGACTNLINIINDILDISKIESGKLEIFHSSYEFASLLNDVITISRMRLGAKPLMFLTDIDSRLPAKLIGDETRIKQILLNILSNAIKFTQEGHISLRISGDMKGNQVTLRFSVRDSGVGIKQEDLELLFEEFERVNTTKNRSIEGTGLGLAISKQLCEMMGGYITVESTYGKGSEFTAVIPQEYSSGEQLTRVEGKKQVLLYEPRERYRLSISESLENLNCICVSCANQSELYNSINLMPYDHIMTAALHLKKVLAIVQKYELTVPVAAFVDYGETVNDNNVCSIAYPVNCLQLSALLNGLHEVESFSRHNSASINFIAPSARVLVVDDNPVNLQVAKGLMEPYQFSVETAVNGSEAVRMVKHTEYDLVFMDHMMPEMDGIDATVAIRKYEGAYYQNLPIIALTANALVGTREMFFREGMNDFLAKPIEINKLAHLLLKWLPQTKIVKSVPLEPVKAAEKMSFFDIPGVNTTLGIRAVGGSEKNYLQILTAYYADGMQKCCSLPQHFTKNDITAFRIEIHALKSTSASIGASELSLTAAKLETAAQENDTLFINRYLDGFLDSLQTILNSIRPIISAGPVSSSQSTYTDIHAGDAAYFKMALNSLSDAAAFANINMIEKILDSLDKFIWTDEISNTLRTIKQYLSVFDYDAILDCVIQLKDSSC